MSLSTEGAKRRDPWRTNPEATEMHFRLYAAINRIDLDRWHRERPHVRYTPCLRPAGDPWAHRTAPSYVQALRPAGSPWGRR